MRRFNKKVSAKCNVLLLIVYPVLDFIIVYDMHIALSSPFSTHYIISDKPPIYKPNEPEILKTIHQLDRVVV